MKKFFQSILFLAAIAMAPIMLTGCSDSNDDAPAVPGETTKYSDVNKWVFDYMKSHYLWNEPIDKLQLNGSAAYDIFFQSILTGIDALDHMNRDDGHWVNGKRENFYSYIKRTEASKSRAFGEEETGSGITFMSAMRVSQSTNEVWLLPAIVVPDSPADKAGIKRGDAISKIDGKEITLTNYESMAKKLVDGNVTVSHIVISYNSNGSISGYDETENVSLKAVTYEDPAIYLSKVLTLSNGKKAGYLLYMYFDMAYDDNLIDIFRQFKAQGVNELILDLRYNGGGHVLASTLLGTLIAGNKHKGEIYNRTTYNAARTAKGEVGVYRFATETTPEGSYKKIATAASESLGLDRIYVLCSEMTASASELIINGLRGVGITVNLIGTTTNGKNVGMESVKKTIGTHKYELTPITFYSQNAKGFSDYSNGFTPDYELDEESYMYGDFGSQSDPLCSTAMRWIITGSKPQARAQSRGISPASRLSVSNQPSHSRYQGAIAVPGRIDEFSR